MRSPTLGATLGALLFVLSLLLSAGARCQTVNIVGVETATQDRLEDPGWWPTKGTYPRDRFVGSAACRQCHGSIFKSQQTTPMAHAAHFQGASSLQQKAPPAFQNDPYSYVLLPSDVGTVLSVADGPKREATPPAWTFGSGEIGQTYVYQQDGVWFESRVSLYTSSGQLDITTGHSHLPPESLHDALGLGMKDAAARRCFGCHTSASTTAGRFEAQNATPGVTCEACHGPGADHVKAMTTGVGVANGSGLINPAKLSPVDSVDFCGACHRTWADIAFSEIPKRGVDVVRFQPYRLEKSRCWGKSGDARLTCVTCHDPHVPLQRDAALYDSRCLSCHLRHDEVTNPLKPGAACPRAADHCTTCHMPKINVPEMHGDFTDHFIRVVNQNAALPE